MISSSWQETRARSQYHFDAKKLDPRWDCIQYLGRFVGDWQQELTRACCQSRPATWATRGYKTKEADIPSEDLIKEHNDLESIGMDLDSEITDLHWDIDPVFQRMVELLALDQTMTRLHVQWPGQVWNLHIDKLQKWCPEDPNRVMRVMIHLEDWQPGHFWSYGNFVHSAWRRGDITTFDWQNVPHCTANAGHVPRCTLQVTGIKTSATQSFVDYLHDHKEFAL